MAPPLLICSFDPARQSKLAIIIERPKIARTEPIVVECAFVSLFWPQIPLHHVGAAHADFADLAGWHARAVRLSQTDFDTFAGSTHGTRARELQIGACHLVAGFGHAVGFYNGYAEIGLGLCA